MNIDWPGLAIIYSLGEDKVVGVGHDILSGCSVIVCVCECVRASVCACVHACVGHSILAG